MDAGMDARTDTRTDTGARTGTGTPADTGALSRWADLDGPVHYLDFGGPASGPLVVCVHGLGGAAVNWLALGPLLAERCRVLALDLPGFGLTRSAGRSTSVQANGDLARRFVAEVGGGPALWVGNSMGGLITLLAAAERPDLVRGAALLDPAWFPRVRHRPNLASSAVFAAYFTPGLGRAVVAGRRRARTAEQSVHDMLTFCCADPGRVAPEVVAAHVRLTQQRAAVPGLALEFEVAARSVLGVIARRRRLAALAAGVSVPVLVLHGERDRLVPLRAASELAAANPTWRYAVAADVGHLPMLEVPHWTAEQLDRWMRDHGLVTTSA